ncbi:MAG: aspartate 1-decarboxylase [Chloroflexi bacterium]|nr:aspartate 1-decarboxylase [Chloroflexota bacterium]
MRIMLKSKIHRAWVTDNNPDYIGSIVIDRDLMERTDIKEFEQVVICNATNGYRWETYALPGPRGSGEVSVQGAGARLCQKGDCLIILAYEVTDELVFPKMVLVDKENQFVDYIPAHQYLEEDRRGEQVHGRRY